MSVKRHRLASPYCQHNAVWRDVTLSSNGDWRYGICPLCNLHASERLRLPAEARTPDGPPPAHLPPATEDDARQWRYQL